MLMTRRRRPNTASHYSPHLSDLLVRAHRNVQIGFQMSIDNLTSKIREIRSVRGPQPSAHPCCSVVRYILRLHLQERVSSVAQRLKCYII